MCITLLLIEVGSGVGRLLIGKNFKIPYFMSKVTVYSPRHPCNEMKTDVLLSHVPNNPGQCKPLGGKVTGEYVVYDVSQKEKPILITLGGSTTSGFYQHFSEGKTWPYWLAELTQDYYYVMNGGIGGYESLQELYKFIRDGSRIKNLGVVVSLNGLKERPDYHNVPNIKTHPIRSLVHPFLTEIQYKMNSIKGAQS